MTREPLGLAALAMCAFAANSLLCRAAAALFVYALGFSLAYARIPAALGALLLFGAVQVTMVGRSLASGDRPRASEWAGLALAAAPRRA